MARFNMAEAEQYSEGGARANYFSLKNDRDTARVRLLYGTMDDVQGYAVYKVKVGDKDRWVNSLRAYNEPIEKDPFAMAGYKAVPRLFIPMLNVDTNEVVFWERSKKYFARIASIAQRYNPLYNEIIEIERNGVAGSKETEYQFYPIENSEFDMESIEIPDVLGTIVLDKTYEEMQYYLEHGDFPQTSQHVAETRQSNYQAQNNMPTGRRTPGKGRQAF